MIQMEYAEFYLHNLIYLNSIAGREKLDSMVARQSVLLPIGYDVLTYFLGNLLIIDCYSRKDS